MDCSTPGFPVCYLPEFNICPLSRWSLPNISSSVDAFSFHPQSFPASGSFSMSWHFTLRCQSIGASASESVLPVDIQGWFPLGLTVLISLLPKGLSRVFSSTAIFLLLGVYGPILTRLLIFVPTILIPACDSLSHAFRTMYFTYKLNRWGGNIQAWCIPFPILNYSVIQGPVLTVLSWPA